MKQASDQRKGRLVVRHKLTHDVYLAVRIPGDDKELAYFVSLYEGGPALYTPAGRLIDEYEIYGSQPLKAAAKTAA